MATTPQQCPNYETNLLMCPCTSDTCPNRGICCECIANHVAAGGAPMCMRGTKRNPDTMGLQARAVTACTRNQARNLERCTCTWEPCERKGVCCNCIRNHFSVDGTGRVSCVK